LASLGNVYKRQKKYLEAIKFHVRSLKLRMKFFGRTHSRIAASCESIAGVYDLLKDHKSAKAWYLKSWQIKRSTMGKDNVEVLDVAEDIQAIEIDLVLCYNKCKKIY